MSQPPRGASVRAVVIALACVGVFAWITPYNDYDLQNTYIAGNLFPIGAMVALLVLVGLVNPLLHRVAPRSVFRPAELGLVWCVIAIASGIPAAGLWRYCIPAATSLRYYATAENHWNDLLTPRLTPFRAPAGEAASQQFYEGSAGGAIPWHAWRAPLVMWGIAAALVFYACACLTVLLRRQWVERERFSFPLTQLPMELAAAAEEGHALNRFLRTPTVWAGAAIPLLVHGVNGLHLYFPGVPRVDLHHDVGQYLPNTFPWWSIRWG
ncbi:MAG: hypothetical protein HYU66_28255, partial [Armatimonadetes bacterium]|nr:hypothetical protein [Armatimonadota bacterium]